MFYSVIFTEIVMLFSALLVRSYLANFSVKAFSLNQEMTSGVSLAVLTTTWSKYAFTILAELDTIDAG